MLACFNIQIQQNLRFDPDAHMIVPIEPAWLSSKGMTERELSDIGISTPAVVRIRFDLAEGESGEPLPVARCCISIDNRNAVQTSTQPVSAFTVCWWALSLALRAIRIATDGPIHSLTFHSHPPIISYSVYEPSADGRRDRDTRSILLA